MPVTIAMVSETTKWAAPLALTRGLLIGLCVCWPSSTSAEGTERDLSQDQTHTGDLVENFRLAAEQGDAFSQYALGNMYRDGRGVPQDETEAVRWYRLAADQGLAAAQFNLGNMYGDGRGVPQDETEAVRWYRFATDQGLAAAQFNLGNMYRDGRGVPQDETEAVRWYRLAAGQRYAAAQVSLGIMSAEGRGVPQDRVAAYMWLSLAAARLAPASGRNAMVEARDAVAERMTADQVADAQRLAHEWKPIDEHEGRVRPMPP